MNHIKIICFSFVLILGAIGDNDLLAQSLDQDYNDLPRFEQTDDISFKVYPNPTTDYISVSTDQKFDGSFKLNNIFGKILLEGEISKEGKKIDLLKFRSGIYIISVYDTEGKKVTTRKIIKN